MKITKCKSKKCSVKCKYFVRYKTRSGDRKAKHFHSYKLAKEFYNEQIVLQETGMLTSEYAQKLTLNEYVTTVPLTRGNETTQVSMQQLYDKHIKNKLGGYKLRDLERKDIQKFMDEDLAGYSPQSKKKIKRILTTAFKYASSDGIIVRNPAENVIIEGEQRLREPHPLTPEQLSEFITLWDNDEKLSEFSNVIVGLAYTGMRPAELGAVTWDDVDLTKRTIDLNKSIRIDSKGKQYDSSKMKTARSSRVLAIDEELLARLRFRKTTNPSDKYVFSSSQGKQLNLNNFRSRYFKPAILKTELPIERPYDLRHTFGALMWSRGVKLDRLSRMFGHSSYTTTESWYGTWYREADFSGIEDLEKWKQQQA